MWRILAIILLAAALLPGSARADNEAQARTGLSIVESAPNKDGERLFSIQADRVEIGDLLHTMFKKVNAEVAIDQDVAGPVTLVVKDVTFKDALQWVVQVARPPIKIARSKTDNVYHVSRDAEAQRVAAEVQNRIDAMHGGFTSQGPPSIVPRAGGGFGQPISGLPNDRVVTLDVPLNRAIPLSEALSQIGSQARIPVNLDSRIPRDLTFTGRITQAPLSLVLQTIANTSGLKLVTIGNQATFVPTDEFQIRLNEAVLGQSSAAPCPRCGQPVVAGWHFCPNCGAQLQVTRQSAQPTIQPRRRGP